MKKKTTNGATRARCRTKKTENATDKVRDLIGLSSKADLNGSYTGKPWKTAEMPEQDADDL